MNKHQLTKTELEVALSNLDVKHGGFQNKVSAVNILGHLSEKLPSLELEESGDLYRIYEPLTEQYLWPEKAIVAFFNETIDRLASDIVVATGKKPTDLPTFEFSITRAVTVSARVRVTAATIEQAQRIALQPEFFTDPEKAHFKVDQGQESQVPFLACGDNYVIAHGDSGDAIDSVTGKDVRVQATEEPSEDPSP